MKFNVEENQAGSGVYKITNQVNGKSYIGKTINFRRRYNCYLSGYRYQDTNRINEYFLTSMNKYGIENFIFEVVEECDIDILSDRELHWMLYYNSTNSENGYNLRMDSSTGMIVHDSTRDKISKRIKREYSMGLRDPEVVSKHFREFWQDKENLERMRNNVSEARNSFFIQKLFDGKIVAIWKNINQILTHRPSYKWQNIYAACNGNKHSYKGYKWERVQNIEGYDASLIVEESWSLVTYKKQCNIDDNKEIKKSKIYHITHDDASKERIYWNELKRRFPNAPHKFSRLKRDKIDMYGVTIERFVNEQD